MSTISIIISFLLFLFFPVFAYAELIEGSAKKKYIIAYSGAPTSIDYWKKIKESMLLRAKELDVILVDFSNNTLVEGTQKKSLLQAIELNIDGLIVGAVEEDIVDTIEVFREKGIPVVAVNDYIKNDWISSTVATNNYKAAEIAGKFILNTLNKPRNTKTKKVLIFTGDKAQEDALIRADVSMRMLKDAGYDVQIHYAKEWKIRHSLAQAIDEYEKNSQNIVASFSCFADATNSSVEVAESFGLRPLHIGFDMDDIMYKMIEEGRLDATVAQDPQQIGIVALQTMLQILNKEGPVAKMIEVPTRLITRTNIKNFK